MTSTDARSPCRAAQPGDIADAAVYLASPLSGFVHGSSLVVDGGSARAS